MGIFSSVKYFKEHIAAWHGVDKPTLGCGHCDYMSDSEDNMNQHMTSKHVANMENVEAPICWSYKQGNCRYGSLCKFRHVKSVKSVETPRNPGHASEHKSCRNGINCRFLRLNRCNYYHAEAEQPSEGGEWRQANR